MSPNFENLGPKMKLFAYLQISTVVAWPSSVYHHKSFNRTYPEAIYSHGSDYNFCLYLSNSMHNLNMDYKFKQLTKYVTLISGNHYLAKTSHSLIKTQKFKKTPQSSYGKKATHSVTVRKSCTSLIASGLEIGLQKQIFFQAKKLFFKDFDLSKGCENESEHILF